jgi:hypothetical protein
MTRSLPRLAGALLILSAAIVPAQPQPPAPAAPAAPPKAATPIEVGQTVSGSLGPGDGQLPDGEYYDQYVFQGQSGQTYSIRMNSDAFDTYLILIDPSGVQHDNDDLQDGTNAGIDLTLTSSGQCQIGATSYSAGETGDYTLTVTQGTAPAEAPMAPPAPSAPPAAPPAPGTMPTPPPSAMPGTTMPPAPQPAPAMPAAPPAPGTAPEAAAMPAGPMASGGTIAVGQTVTGQLMAGDQTLPTGEYCDTYAIDVTPGQVLHIRVSSPDFDTFLIYKEPNGQQQENDDLGDNLDSGLDVTAAEAGTAQIGVTSFASGATGTYTLSVQ